MSVHVSTCDVWWWWCGRRWRVRMWTPACWYVVLCGVRGGCVSGRLRVGVRRRWRLRRLTSVTRYVGASRHMRRPSSSKLEPPISYVGCWLSMITQADPVSCAQYPLLLVPCSGRPSSVNPALALQLCVLWPPRVPTVIISAVAASGHYASHGDVLCCRRHGLPSLRKKKKAVTNCVFSEC